MLKEKSGFTLIELLVVISIIAILAALSLPAIVKARKQASIHKVTAEMTSLASTGATIYIDLKSRGYVPLTDYSLTDPTPVPPTDPTRPLNISRTATGYETASFTFGASGDFTNAQELTDRWDGPYAVHQPKTTHPTVGSSYPTMATGVTGWAANSTYFPDGTPLDAWGHPYGMGWNIAEQVMVIYSAGPNGKIETNCGDTTPIGDDLLYKFR